jgi:hypothetical protein
MPTDPPKSAFSNDDLVELEWVFASVCEALEANEERQDEEAKACIRRRLFMLACNNGMSDPASLRDHLVRSFARSNQRRMQAAYSES